MLWVPRYGSALQPMQGRRVGHKKATKHHGVSSGGVISAAADPIDGFLRSRDAEFSAKFHDTSSSSGTAYKIVNKSDLKKNKQTHSRSYSRGFK